MIHKLGKWVLRKAIADLKKWQDKGFNELRIAVNLSPVQLCDTDIVSTVLNSCGEFGVDPSRLELEITESTLVENYNQTSESMQSMSDAGVFFTLDDFGKGFSSLSYLRKLPINTIKIDRSFIEETLPSAQDQTILNGIISLAQGLALRVTAEGVETEHQKRVLSMLGCDEVQGSLYSEPVTFKHALRILDDYNGKVDEGSEHGAPGATDNKD